MMATPGPSISDIDRIAALPDGVIRNLQITQCYHELALALKERTGGSANWCTFATWASKQAGQTIRKEDFIRTLELILGSEAMAKQAARDLAGAVRWLGVFLNVEDTLELVLKAYDPEAAFERSSAAVAGGNLKVFAEIGREFARFHARCLSDPVYDPGSIDRFCEALRAGDPPEGQGALRQAFRCYYQALFEKDEKARTELMLFANLEIGLHEQTRLQPEISAALAAPLIDPIDFARNLLDVLHPGWERRNQVLLHLIRSLGRLIGIEAALKAVHAVAQREAQYIITETMMTIGLPPPNRLRLGDDLAAGFPPLLEHIVHPELLALLARIDPTPDSTRGSGAEYWGDLPDRMHFITDMFRCYELSAPLFEPPFTPEQTTTLKEGRLPAGRL